MLYLKYSPWTNVQSHKSDAVTVCPQSVRWVHKNHKMSVCKSHAPLLPHRYRKWHSSFTDIKRINWQILTSSQGLKPNQFHKCYCMLLKDRNDNLIIKSKRSMLQVST